MSNDGLREYKKLIENIGAHAPALTQPQETYEAKNVGQSSLTKGSCGIEMNVRHLPYDWVMG